MKRLIGNARKWVQPIYYDDVYPLICDLASVEHDRDDLRRKLEEAKAEKKQKQAVIDNLKSSVLPDVCKERDEANHSGDYETEELARAALALPADGLAEETPCK